MPDEGVKKLVREGSKRRLFPLVHEVDRAARSRIAEGHKEELEDFCATRVVILEIVECAYFE
jgi:hypothetical protein